MAPGSIVPAAGWQPAALHEVVPVAELLDELRHLQEVVAVVGIAHDDELAPRGGDAAYECVAVAPGGHLDDARPHAPCNVLRAIRASVVRHDDLAGGAAGAQRHVRLVDAYGQRVRLVEAGHHDRHLHRRVGGNG